MDLSLCSVLTHLFINTSSFNAKMNRKMIRDDKGIHKYYMIVVLLIVMLGSMFLSYRCNSPAISQHSSSIPSEHTFTAEVIEVVTLDPLFTANETPMNPMYKDGSCPESAWSPQYRVNLPRLLSQFQPNGNLNSSLWLDHPDAHTKIEDYQGISAEEKKSLHHFTDHGWFLIDIPLDDNFLQSLETNIQATWKKRPSNVLGARFQEKPVILSNIPMGQNFEPGVRLIDAHNAIPELDIFMNHPKIQRMVNLILQDVAVATQSLYFPYGSKQHLHRDPWYVITTPIENMVACWIALEDIHIDSGPLSFVSDSHRMSYFPLLKTNDIIFHHPDITQEAKNDHTAALLKEVELSGLHLKHFTAKKGQVFFWHSGLIHGGSEVANPKLTRKSFVIHFDKLKYHPRKGANYEGDKGQKLLKYCDKVTTSKECYHYFNSPLTCDGQA